LNTAATNQPAALGARVDTPLRGGRPEPIADPTLRVLLLNYEYPPMGGGAGNATRCTAIELARRGHAVHVLTSRLPAQPVVETVDGVTVCRVWSLRRSLHRCGLFGAGSYIASAFVELVRLARTYDYDVYHFYFGLPTAILALYVHFVLGKPYIIALRGSDVPGYDDTKWYMRPLHALLRPLTRYLWRNARCVTTLTRNLQELARKTAADVETVVIGNGIDAERYPRKPAEARPATTGLRLIAVCRLIPRKGLEFLIEAMDQLKHDGTVLEIVGSGQDQQLIEKLIEKRGLQDHVKLSGYVPSEQLYIHYHRADLFVLPSLSESFGQVLLEAMSCGLPVVATTVGGIPEVIRDRTGGVLVAPRSAAALVDSVRWLAANPKQRERMGRYNADKAREQYTWRTIASSYEALYYRIIDAATGTSERRC
jgi:glycosyltransferase involved in cell wall biosynthesis